MVGANFRSLLIDSYPYKFYLLTISVNLADSLSLLLIHPFFHHNFPFELIQLFFSIPNTLLKFFLI